MEDEEREFDEGKVEGMGEGCAALEDGEGHGGKRVCRQDLGLREKTKGVLVWKNGGKGDAGDGWVRVREAGSWMSGIRRFGDVGISIKRPRFLISDMFVFAGEGSERRLRVW